MKLRSAPLDDIHETLKYTLEDDGVTLARVLLCIIRHYRRTDRCISLALLRIRWHSGALEREARPIPELGAEPFNLSDAELEAEWRDV